MMYLIPSFVVFNAALKNRNAGIEKNNFGYADDSVEISSSLPDLVSHGPHGAP